MPDPIPGTIPGHDPVPRPAAPAGRIAGPARGGPPARPGPCRSRRAALLLGAGAALALPGCASLFSRPYIEIQRFALDPAPPPGRGPGGARRGGKVLLVRLLRAAPGQEQRGLRTLRADGTETADFHNEWTAPPADLVEEVVRRWLIASGLFAAVVAPGSRAPADLILEAELTTLQAEPARGLARAGMSAVVLRGADGRVASQLVLAGTAPLATPDPPAAARAAAMNAALADLLGQLESRLAPLA
ncbi:hypothetical protein M0638_25925 [Roseomonas sp. NAR14]|uniref:ABC-type transport auxiliary lipoprotein component domain-containing protein n=1 Tax=Roseomonas acroporae TaxID=2937791 RepID=A0A9X2BZ98_9PROT|nr:hypothetical protein [Roseomonas acroporae]MCK8787799.1 hypothetical protein [Roseomonas acroporae]